MTPHTFQEPHDDPAFLVVIDRIIGSRVRRDAPREAYLVHVNNWFGPRWLRFSGKGRVGFFFGCAAPDTALDEFRCEALTFPPFTPNRVVAQYYFCRTGPAVYEERAAPRLVHPQRLRPSANNLHRRVAAFAPSAQFYWYSSGTARADRGCLMAYAVRDGELLPPWYVALVRGVDQWRVERAAGLDIAEARCLAEVPPPV